MPVANGVGAFTAFERLLRSLCLNEFPCGSGSWRSSDGANVDPATQFTATTRDYGSDKEQLESLEELVTSTSSPYAVDYNWSREARQLREIAVKSPWLISREFILRHFQSLRIVDKNVTEIDPAMLQFPALEELTLSANLLTSVNSEYLPRTLTVLELVANQISDLEELCVDPPQLQHLGLAHNKLSTLHDYLTGEHWPCLLSLDLSHNNLTELRDLLQSLLTLAKLRNLALIGNPLALIPGYRGYTVDSLRSLIILDDTQITADEKHRFKGLARRGDFVRDEAQVIVKIQSLTGISKPPELDVTEDAPQFPVTNRYYYVEFLFLEDFNSKEERLIKDSSEDEGEEGKEKKPEELMSGQDQPGQTVVSNGEMHTAADTAVNGHSESIFANQGPQGLEIDIQNSVEDGIASPPPTLKLKSYRTQGVQWSDDSPGILDVGYCQELIIDDLPALKQCLQQGLQLAVREDMVLSHPPEEGDGTISQASHKKPAKGDKKEDKKVEKGGKKKKKEPEIELIHSPPVVTTLGTYTLDLGSLTSGEHVAQEVCTCHVIERVATEEQEEEKDKSNDRKEKKKKGGSELEVSRSRKGKEGKDKQGKKTVKSARLDRAESGLKHPPAKGPTEEQDEGEPPPPPPPLTVSVRVELVRWNTAQDSIPKDEGKAT